MKKELLDKLIDRFPYIQNEHNVGLQWGSGVDCGDGWYELLYTLLEKIEDIYKRNNRNINDFTIEQIKEKYGELRFYASSNIPEVNALIVNTKNYQLRYVKIVDEPAHFIKTETVIC